MNIKDLKNRCDLKHGTGFVTKYRADNLVNRGRPDENKRSDFKYTEEIKKRK